MLSTYLEDEEGRCLKKFESSNALNITDYLKEYMCMSLSIFEMVLKGEKVLEDVRKLPMSVCCSTSLLALGLAYWP